MSNRFLINIIFLALVAGSCVPREQVVLRSVDIREVLPGKDGNPLLKADAIFYNPNSSRMRLKRIDIDVLVDGKKAARVDQHLSALIKPKSEFTVPPGGSTQSQRRRPFGHHLELVWWQAI